MNALILIILCTNLCVADVYSQQSVDSIQKSIELNTITVVGNPTDARLKIQAHSAVRAEREYLMENRNSSLMATLEKLLGINALQIGQGGSKPIVRGLGFNRVAVVENGIKQQGQQWGADHGLEIDQYNVDYIEIIKGATSFDIVE